MTNKETYESFKELVEKWQEPTIIAHGLGSSVPLARLDAKEKSRKYVSETREIMVGDDVSSDVLNGALVADSERFREDSQNHFNGNYESIVKGIDGETLEDKFLHIEPFEMDSPNKHNEVLELHRDYMGFNAMLQRYEQTGSLPSKQEKIFRHMVANNKAEAKRREIKDQGYSENVQSLCAISERQLMYTLADDAEMLQEGRNVAEMKKKKIEGVLSDHNMNKRAYAQRNLLAGINHIMDSDEDGKEYLAMQRVYDVAEGGRLLSVNREVA